MKQFFTVSVVAFTLSATAFAQTEGTTVFAVNAGYNSASVTANQTLTNSSRRSGFNAGVSADYFLSEVWSIKGRLSYSQKGWSKGVYLTGSGPVTADYHINYLTLPVTANWHFGYTRNWYLNFGPYVGVLLSASETAGGTNLKKFLNSTDFGGDMGIGIKLPVSDRSGLFIELEGQAGVTNLFKNAPGTTTRNNVLGINIGFDF